MSAALNRGPEPSNAAGVKSAPAFNQLHTGPTQTFNTTGGAPIQPSPSSSAPATTAASAIIANPNHTSSFGGPTTAVEEKKKYDPKDPLRPRRKKARRACFACQRAHLTCGDERPCQRCIKRGLGDACQDGVRKKAKYLHDAPPEALRPVLGPNYNPNAPAATPPTTEKATTSVASTTLSDSSSVAGSNLYATSTTSFPVFSTGAQTPIVTMPEGIAGFNLQTSPVSPTFQAPVTTDAGRSRSIPGLSTLANTTSTDTLNFNALFDPSNPAFYSFEIENLDHLNFGSQYPAMEFGMLGHMSKAAESVTREHTASISGPSNGGINFDPYDSANAQFPVFDSSMLDLSALDPTSAAFAQSSLGHGLPHAYAISAGSNSLASPSTENTASPQTTAHNGFDSPTAAPGYQPPVSISAAAAAATASMARPKPKLLKTTALLGKRRRDPSAIYESVKEPYPYINGFHKLIAFLRGRFPPDKTLKIAKSLSSIRPSFMSCTKSLNLQDLIFMEKCLQRTLFEYEDFMQHTSAPTIVCRRTGEVAAVNKEFTALTGWTKDVLLGKAPNENVNTGIANRSANTTPIQQNVVPDGKPQPVFIPELLDDESVVQFYEDYAHLAFGDSRGHVNRKCRLLKYHTADEMHAARPPSSSSAASTAGMIGPVPPVAHGKSGRSLLSSRVIKIDSEHGISKIEKDGKVDCTYCWVIKRDVFDIPMLIVINFLPCYYRNQDPLPV